MARIVEGDFAFAGRGPKSLTFLVRPNLFVRHASRVVKFVNPISPLSRLNLETILILLDRILFVVLNLRSILSISLQC